MFYQKNSILGFKDFREENLERSSNRFLTGKETILKREAKIKFSKIENEF